jgi:hypothetical protein
MTRDLIDFPVNDSMGDIVESKNCTPCLALRCTKHTVLRNKQDETNLWDGLSPVLPIVRLGGRRGVSQTRVCQLNELVAVFKNPMSIQMSRCDGGHSFLTVTEH